VVNTVNTLIATQNMFQHCVFRWLKPNNSGADLGEKRKGGGEGGGGGGGGWEGGEGKQQPSFLLPYLGLVYLCFY